MASSLLLLQYLPHFLQTLCEDVRALLLIDEDDDGRFDSLVEDLYQPLSLLRFRQDLHNLFDTLNRSSNCADLNPGWPVKV